MATDALNEIERMHVNAQAHVAGLVPRRPPPEPLNTIKDSLIVAWPDRQATEENAVAASQGASAGTDRAE